MEDNGQEEIFKNDPSGESSYPWNPTTSSNLQGKELQEGKSSDGIPKFRPIHLFDPKKLEFVNEEDEEKIKQGLILQKITAVYTA